MSATNGTVKLSLEMSEDAAAKLTEIAARAQTSVGEVLRRGAGLYDIAAEAKDDGLKLALLKADQTFVTEIEGV